MANYIFTQNGDNNVQIGDMAGMQYGVNTALKWALNQNFQSVAAQYARILAYEVERQAKDSATLRDDLATARAESARLQSENETLWEEVGYTDGDQVDAARFFHEQKDAISALQAEAERLRAETDAGKRHMHEAHKKIDKATDLLRSSGAPHDAIDLVFGAFWDIDKAMREAPEGRAALERGKEGGE